MSTPKYAPVATTLPLMHGSTSPSKNRLSAHGVSNVGIPPGDVLSDEIDGPPGLLAVGIEPEPTQELQNVERVRPVL